MFEKKIYGLLASPDEVDARVSINIFCSHLSHSKSEGSLFKGSLHVSRPEVTEISLLSCRSALTVLLSDSTEIFLALDNRSKLLNVFNSLVLGSGDGLVSVGIIRVSGIEVLLDDVSNSHGAHTFKLLNLDIQFETRSYDECWVLLRCVEFLLINLIKS